MHTYITVKRPTIPTYFSQTVQRRENGINIKHFSLREDPGKMIELLLFQKLATQVSNILMADI
jgi:hypothetical protein